MKWRLLPAAAALLAATTLSAQSDLSLDEGKYTITNGSITLTVDAAHGGKILSFRLGDKEVLSQMRWPNSFGSTFWTSPQAEWNWPPVPEDESLPSPAQLLEDGTLVREGPVSK